MHILSTVMIFIRVRNTAYIQTIKKKLGKVMMQNVKHLDGKQAILKILIIIYYWVGKSSNTIAYIDSDANHQTWPHEKHLNWIDL